MRVPSKSSVDVKSQIVDGNGCLLMNCVVVGWKKGEGNFLGFGFVESDPTFLKHSSKEKIRSRRILKATRRLTPGSAYVRGTQSAVIEMPDE